MTYLPNYHETVFVGVLAASFKTQRHVQNNLPPYCIDRIISSGDEIQQELSNKSDGSSN